MGKALNLTGQQFGRWTVLYKTNERDSSGGVMWCCQCSCENHTIRNVKGSSLTSGRSKSCGCLQKEKATEAAKKRIEDLTNQKFGRLTVVKRDNDSKHKRVHWWCKCDCGNEELISVAAYSLKNGDTKSCGCYKREQTIKKNMVDITGQTFGFLTALRPTEERVNDTIKWECYCSNCNKIKNISGAMLRTGGVISCGCFKSSKGELKIAEILNELDIKYEKEKTFKDCINPKTNWPLRFDFFLPDYNCCIEYDGQQHFQEWSRCDDTLADRQYRDNIKNEYCKNNNIKLIRIPYWDYNKLDNNYILDFLNNL